MHLKGDVKIARICGIEINADWSLLIIFGLITILLAQGIFPAWHPDWPVWVIWGTSLTAALLFLVSILLHELSHALIGRRVGVVIRKITLFIFGGMAHMENEPSSWRAEMVMALAGPVTSLILGGVLIFFAGFFAGTNGILAEPGKIIEKLPPLVTLLLWLGPVNIVLGLFNLVPGFPLDGGRALRALLWAATGDLVRATRWASFSGQAFSWILMGTGILMVFGLRLPGLGGGLVNGLWLALVGWFLNNAALAAYRQMLVRESLEHVPVSRLMRRDFVSIPPHMTVGRLLDEVLIPSGQRAFPVQEEGQLRGIVFISDLHRLSRDKWNSTPVYKIMVPAADLISIESNHDVLKPLVLLNGRGINQIPVIDNGRLVGLLRRQDILTWLALHMR